MLELVSLQLGHLEEAVPADITRVRALIAVYSHVILVVGLGCKALVDKHINELLH